MKIVLTVIVLAILGIGAYFVLGGPAAEPVLAPANETAQPAVPEQPALPAAPAFTTVIYTAQGFSPEIVTIRVGDTVRFTNQSSNEMWVASANHPTHTQYDGTTREMHCPDGGSFDQCARSGTGTTWAYTFTKAGTFQYHNHAASGDTGTVMVK